MTDYGRFTGRVQFGQNSDLSFPELDSHVLSFNMSASKYKRDQIGLSTASTYISTTGLASSLGMMFVNKSTTAGETIIVTYYNDNGVWSAAAAPNTCTMTASAVNDTLTDDGSSGLFLTTYRAAYSTAVYVSGSTGAVNNGQKEIKSAAASVITLASNAGYAQHITTDNACATATLRFLTKKYLMLPVGSFAILPTNNLYLTSTSIIAISLAGTPELDVYIFGT
jgi:hypothetical protein